MSIASIERSALVPALDCLARPFEGYLADIGMRADSCIWASRVFLFAAHEVGLSARPQPFRVDCFSPAWVARTKADPHWARREFTEEEARALSTKGVRSVTIGDPRAEGVPRPDGSRGYNAHLVVIVENSALLDLTLHQASRPQHGMTLVPWCRPYSAASRFGYLTEEGTYVAYSEVDRTDYREAPDWTRPRRDDEAVGLFVEALQTVLTRVAT